MLVKTEYYDSTPMAGMFRAQYRACLEIMVWGPYNKHKQKIKPSPLPLRARRSCWPCALRLRKRGQKKGSGKTCFPGHIPRSWKPIITLELTKYCSLSERSYACEIDFMIYLLSDPLNKHNLMWGVAEPSVPQCQSDGGYLSCKIKVHGPWSL